MSVEDRFQARYRSGDTPWDIGKPDFNLIEVVTRTPVPAGRALDIGCGTGDNSLWLTIAGSADEVRQGPGPPQRTAADIVLAAEPHFEILVLRSTHFGSNRPDPPRAWQCLMQKRKPKP